MYKTKNKIFFFLVIMTLVILAIGLMGNVSAADQTITNTTNGGLQIAIENVGNGQTVYMENGIYSGENNTNLTIFKSITIQGNGDSVVIDARGLSRIFNISSSVNITLKNLKLINGLIKGEPTYDTYGGAIYSMGNLSVINCTFTNNEANYGGAVYNLGSKLFVSGSIFTNNKAGEYGGAILNIRDLSVGGCIFTNNHAVCGGTIHNLGKLSVSGSTFSNNQAGYEGGAICNDNGDFYVSGSTFSNNQARYGGGAIFSDYEDSMGNLSVNGSIFTNNQAKNGFGGAIMFSSAVLRLDSVTFKNNIANSKYNAIYSGIGAKVYKNKVTITPAENSPVPSDLKIAKVTKKGSYHYVAIKNIGKKSTGKKFYLGVYVGTKRIKIKLAKILGVGKSTTVKVLIAKKYRNSLKTFKADCTNRIKEMNESNNSLKAR